MWESHHTIGIPYDSKNAENALSDVVYTNIDPPGALLAYAFGINVNGDVVGAYSNAYYDALTIMATPKNS